MDTASQKTLKMSKLTPTKSNLPIIVLISLLVLGTSTFFSLSKAESVITATTCTNEMAGKIIEIQTNEGIVLVIKDKNGNTYFPVISSEKIILTEDKSVNVCFKTIDKSNPDHKIIFVEKVVSLPSPNEKR